MSYMFFCEPEHIPLGYDEDAWALIEKAFSVTPKEQQASIRIVQSRPVTAGSLIDSDDILELVKDRLADRLEDRGDAEAAPEFEAAVQAALSFIDITPSEDFDYYDGVFPLPIELRGDEWSYGGSNDPEPDEDDEPVAVITYASEASPIETEAGQRGWCWWVLGEMGDAPTLREAMTQAQVVLERRRGGKRVSLSLSHYSLQDEHNYG